MREFFFVYLYGLVMLVGVFLTIFWARVSLHRAQHLCGWKAVKRDIYFGLTLAIAVLDLGLTILFGGRAYVNAKHGLSNFLLRDNEAIVLGTGLVVVFLGQLLFVRVADMQSKTHLWAIIGLALGALWAVVAALVL